MARTIIGTVSSDKPDKSIVVTVLTRKTHPLYKKQYTESTKFMAHDEKNEAHTGDKVEIVETRPLSARKRYTLSKIVERPLIREEESVEAITKEEAPVKPKKAEKTSEKVEKE
jgi:small subunit ribosomal protein S17